MTWRENISLPLTSESSQPHYFSLTVISDHKPDVNVAMQILVGHNLLGGDNFIWWLWHLLFVVIKFLVGEPGKSIKTNWGLFIAVLSSSLTPPSQKSCYQEKGIRKKKKIKFIKISHFDLTTKIILIKM